MTPKQMLEDYLHFVKIQNTAVAAELGRNLLALDLEGREFVALVEDAGLEARFDDANGLALRIGSLEDVAAGLEKLFLEGKRSVARDPKEISRNISNLVGTNLRARGLARDNLMAASEYAMPQLLEALLNDQKPILRSEVEALMIDMGRDSVTPLCAAITKVDPASQERIARVLGRVGYRTAAPYLLDVAESTNSTSVRNACELALTRMGLSPASLGPAPLYLDLAWRYFDERSELTAFPDEDFQLYWVYDPANGLLMAPVRTPVYHEAMAMRLAERSMELGGNGNDEAITVWVASNLKREIESPPGYDNPTYPATRRPAMDYAVWQGPRIGQMVLAVAIDERRRNTRLARMAIDAIAETGGTTALWNDGSGASPLVRALRYPDRRVQYESALALGKSQPRAAFAGAERVVPTLAGAVRDGGERTALVIAADRDQYTELRRMVSNAGYEVMPFAQRLSDIEGAIAEAAAVDLAVVSLPSVSATRELMDQMRARPKLLATPALLLGSNESVARQRLHYRADPTVSVRPLGISESMMARAISDLVLEAAGGPITQSEADTFAERSLDVLRDLAVARNPVLDVADASSSLVTSMESSQGRRRMQIADVLSYVNQSNVQVALLDAALDGPASQRPEMLGVVAQSTKRFGNMLEPRQIRRVTDLAREGQANVASSAAALMGALNLPDTDLVPLILEERG